MNFFNLNALHNYINVAIVVLGALLLASGCVAVAATGSFDCSKSWLNPQLTAYAMTALAFLKIVLNIARDGFGGLVKVQPPVVDKSVVK